MSEITTQDFTRGWLIGFVSGVVFSGGFLPVTVGVVIGSFFGDSFGIKTMIGEVAKKFCFGQC